MTDRERRVAALAAAFVKERAPALLSRLGTEGALEAVQLGARLAAAPRADRLQALAGAMSSHAEAGGDRVAAAVGLERPQVARVLVALTAGDRQPAGCALLLLRLCRERIGR